MKNSFALEEIVRQRVSLQAAAKQHSEKLENVTAERTALQVTSTIQSTRKKAASDWLNSFFCFWIGWIPQDELCNRRLLGEDQGAKGRDGYDEGTNLPISCLAKPVAVESQLIQPKQTVWLTDWLMDKER